MGEEAHGRGAVICSAVELQLLRRVVAEDVAIALEF
jgi:hypothetical protein